MRRASDESSEILLKGEYGLSFQSQEDYSYKSVYKLKASQIY
jgi:hypothetical protein